MIRDVHPRYRIPDSESQILIPISRIPDPESRILDPGSRILDPGSGLATLLLRQRDIFKIQNILRLEPVELPAINSTLRDSSIPIAKDNGGNLWGGGGGSSVLYSLHNAGSRDRIKIF
jgi:hypothetical protein